MINAAMPPPSGRSQTAHHVGEGVLEQTAGYRRASRHPHASSGGGVSYWIAPDRRIVMLTAFTKTRMRDTAYIERAHAVMAMDNGSLGGRSHTADGEE